ncbi:hypothetical protein DFH09DRAFT_1251904 [Mycena vulgaris]|nr:hypothetical protein DFH09DRAFT_1251904 [Mycena vulgaris]
MFKSYAPILHEHYRTMMKKLHRWDKVLVRNFNKLTSVFASATFNFGPVTVTLPHLDFVNLAWGWFCITALGNFDPNKGEHLILWDLHLVIRFPPGCSIMIPSAILRHSNISIQQGKTRYSFTQFTSAGVFRFVENKFRSDKLLKKQGRTQAEKAQLVEEWMKRFSEGLQMNEDELKQKAWIQMAT